MAVLQWRIVSLPLVSSPTLSDEGRDRESGFHYDMNECFIPLFDKRWKKSAHEKSSSTCRRAQAFGSPVESPLQFTLTKGNR
jgi:hypothetical protein